LPVASPAHRNALSNFELAIAQERTRRVQLWQYWRVLERRRQAEIIGVIIALLIAAGIFFHHRLTTNSPALADNNAQNEPRPVPEDPAAQEKKQNELARLFLKDRKEASAGNWLVYDGNPVLQPGELNDWDDFKVGAPIVIKQGSLFHMWYRACHFVMTEYTCGVGHASSKDGLRWEKSSTPVFIPDNSHERERLDSLAVIYALNQYWMWYSVRPDQFNGFAYPTVHLATSRDGLSWSYAGAVLRALSEYTPSIEPAAYYDGKLFHLWYADYPSDDSPAILHLTSADGKQWQTSATSALEKLGTTPGRLSVVSDGHGGYRAYYAYDGHDRSIGVFDVLVSSDGDRWQRAEAQPKLSFQDLQASGGIPSAPFALTTSEGVWVWYALTTRTGAEEIGIAFLKGTTL